MKFEELQKELEDYKKSKEFEADCLSIRRYYSTFCEGDEMLTDLEIEEEAINEKRIYFEAVNKCMNGLHEWEEGEDDIVNKKYKYCRNCGKTEEIK